MVVNYSTVGVKIQPHLGEILHNFCFQRNPLIDTIISITGKETKTRKQIITL